MRKLAEKYNKAIQDESKKSLKELNLENVGKVDPKKHMAEAVTTAMTESIDQVWPFYVGPGFANACCLQCLGTMVSSVVF